MSWLLSLGIAILFIGLLGFVITVGIAVAEGEKWAEIFLGVTCLIIFTVALTCYIHSFFK